MAFLRHIFDYLRQRDSAQGVQIVDGRIIAPDQTTEFDEIDLRPYRQRQPIPAALLTLDALLRHKDLKPLKKGFVPIGISRKDGTLIQSSWQKMTTGIIAGRRNHGKSSILKNQILLALHARKSGLKCNVYLFDPHHNLPDSTGLFFKPILDQFDQCYLGLESLKDGKHLLLFEELLDMVQRYQEDGFDEDAPWHFIFIDEADLFFQDKEHGKATYAMIRDLVNLRKGRIFFLLSFADTTKSGSGNIGTGLIAAGTTVFCVSYDLTRARLVLQGPGEAQRALNLPVGYAVVKIPDEKRVTVCQMPYVTEADLTPFLSHSSPIRPKTVATRPAAPQPEKIILRDGEIIRSEQITAWDKLFGGVFYKQGGFQLYAPKSTISPEQIAHELRQLAEFDDGDAWEAPHQEHGAPAAAPPEPAPTPDPPASTTPPGYLVTGDYADFDGFLTYLDTRLARRTVAEYGQDLKTWQRLLRGDLSAEGIHKALSGFDYARAMRMKGILTTYGQYRLTIGDATLATLLAAHTFNLAKPPDDEKPANRQTLSDKEIEMYHTIAKQLCEEGKRAGVWIELCLLGVKPSQIEHVQLLNKTTIQEKKGGKHAIPAWLHEAMTGIPDWRLSRKTIHKEVSQHETTPSLLNTAARAYRSVDGASVS